jgi:hypothetical protein
MALPSAVREILADKDRRIDELERALRALISALRQEVGLDHETLKVKHDAQRALGEKLAGDDVQKRLRDLQKS